MGLVQEAEEGGLRGKIKIKLVRTLRRVPQGFLFFAGAGKFGRGDQLTGRPIDRLKLKD